MDHPNAISALLTKRAELAGLIQKTEADLRRMVCDLDHLDACIRLFDPEADTSRIKRYPTKHRARRGEVTKFVLDSLRQTDRPITSQEIARGLIARRGMNADDATFTLIRQRVGACIYGLAAKGFVQEIGLVGNFKEWAIKSSKS